MSTPDHRAWLTLLRIPGVGAAGLRTLLQQAGSADAALRLPVSALRALKLPEAALAWLARPDAARIEADLDWLAQSGHHLLTWDRPDYPALLRELPRPPMALFVRGRADLLWTAQIAMVGTRNPTEGGRDNATQFARHFARAGFTVTSGLADGIDTAAHQAALKAGAPTIAVVGTGPDLAYPARNAALADAIARDGAIVSEFPPGTEARREHFPQRNRVIAGLALGTLVVEAAQRSGALITARHAADAGREVFALPGSIHNPMARGCHRLIRDGATLVESAPELLEALAPAATRLAGALRQRLQPDAAADDTPDAVSSAPADPQDPDHVRVLAALGHDPVPIDTLAERSGLTVDALSSILLILELDGRVSATHGHYARRAP